MGDLLDRLVDEINGWDDGYQFKASYTNDGDGHFDFMGLRVTEEGRKALAIVLASTSK
jgi:hypothetical protein